MKNTLLKILVIEDNHTIAQQLIEFFESKSWQVDYADNGHLGLSLALSEPFDLILLDLGLPDIDGLAVCQHIKSHSSVNIPILMLTARDAFEDKAKGFNLGADDYVTKPFELRELVLRCEALTRRQSLYQNQVMTLGDLTLHMNEQRVTLADQDISLNATAFKILRVLAQAYPQPVSRSMLIHKIWADEPPNSNALKSHIYNLRSGLDVIAKTSRKSGNTIKPSVDKRLKRQSSMVQTITNIGYKLVLNTP